MSRATATNDPVRLDLCESCRVVKPSECSSGLQAAAGALKEKSIASDVLDPSSDESSAESSADETSSAQSSEGE